MAKDIIPGGLADKKPDSDFDPKALKEGIKVEMEHTSDPNIAKEISKDHITENPGYYAALKTMERKLEGRKFKKSALVKGVKQRLFPVGQEQKEHKAIFGKPLTDRLEGWQRLNRPEERAALANQIGQLPPNTMKRAVIDLSKKTATRRNQDTGELEFLLHRGVGNTERENAIDIPSRQTMHASHTSWTPNVAQAQHFAISRNKPNSPSGLLSAWIPQSAIATIPKHWGSYSAEDRGFPGGPNEYQHEHEIIIHPGNYELVHDRDVKKLIGRGKREGPGVYTLDQAINFRAKPDVDRADVTETYAQERAGRKFKKSSLAKAPIIQDQPSMNRPHQSSMYEGMDNIKTYDAGTFDVDPNDINIGHMAGSKLYHHVYKKPSYEHAPDKAAYLHALSVSPDPWSESGVLISSSVNGGNSPDQAWSPGTPWKPEDKFASIGETIARPGVRGRGLGTKLYEHILGYHGRLASDTSVSPPAQRVWQKLSSKTGVKSGMGSEGQRDVNWAETSNRYQDPVATQEYGGESEFGRQRKLTATEFKKSSLIKGAMRRLAPWNKEAKTTTENASQHLHNWQEGGYRADRAALSQMKIDDSSKKRMLHKLSSKTPTKLHSDGTRSFLLHRGMDIGEYKNAKDYFLGKPAIRHSHESSWTPNLTISGGFASDAGRDLKTKGGAHVSAWIHEDDIAMMPNQHRDPNNEDDYTYEQEVIVKPSGNRSPLVHKDDVAKLTGVDKDDEFTHPGGQILDNPDRMINFRQKSQGMFGTDPIARNKYIMPEFKRNRFKKSQLAKAPVAYHGSKYDFDQFSTDFSGSNQGNASGHGVYFSDKPEGASFYAKLGEKTGTGGMYSANIPEHDQFMNWDLPISKHPKKIAHAMRSTPSYRAHIEKYKKDPSKYLHPEQLNGAQIYNNLENHGMNQKEASHFMHQLGVKGIKRKAGNVNHLIVFKPEDIKMISTPRTFKKSLLKR